MQNMKKFSKIVLFIFIVILISSCGKDYLELLPRDGLVQNEYWKRQEDVEAVLMGAYEKFASMHDRLFLYGELRGDMIERNTNISDDEARIMLGNIEPNNYLSRWDDFYEVINYSNFVIKYAPHVQELDNTFTEFQMKAYQAEAIFLRSLAYFYLVRIFKDVPLVLQPTENDAVELFPAKSADTTILRVIKEDLKEALVTVREDYGSLKRNKGRANKGAINALIADIALWNFEYEECLEYIENIESLNYELLKPGDWYNLFYPGNSFESIFEFQFDEGLNQFSYLLNLTDRRNGDYKASEFAAEMLGPERSKEGIRGFGTLEFYNQDYYIWKYRGIKPDGTTTRGGSENQSQNWIIYRYSDILLMKAEALSQKSNPEYEAAKQLINKIRERAFMSQIQLPDNPVTIEDAIMRERIKEFAYEGKRWFDIVRMGRRNGFARKDELIKIVIEDAPSTQKLVLASKLTDPYGWYLPIHFGELEDNANLIQNPYYQVYEQDNY
jgi:hypothetical protein